MNNSTCSVSECSNSVIARGWCPKHYQRWRKTGDPEYSTKSYYGYFSSHEEAFKAHTRWHGDCLIWEGTKLPKGYGTVSALGVKKYAHRYAWERQKGEIPEGLSVNHTCWNANCVNIQHLELVTTSENNSYRVGPQVNNNHSGVRNVEKKRDKWSVRLQKNGRRYHFGTYPTVEEAAVVAEQARKDLFGDFAGRG